MPVEMLNRRPEAAPILDDRGSAGGHQGVKRVPRLLNQSSYSVLNTKSQGKLRLKIFFGDGL
jgi:hypothetical protein